MGTLYEPMALWVKLRSDSCLWRKGLNRVKRGRTFIGVHWNFLWTNGFLEPLEGCFGEKEGRNGFSLPLFSMVIREELSAYSSSFGFVNFQTDALNPARANIVPCTLTSSKVTD